MLLSKDHLCKNEPTVRSLWVKPNFLLRYTLRELNYRCEPVLRENNEQIWLAGFKLQIQVGLNCGYTESNEINVLRDGISLTGLTKLNRTHFNCIFESFFKVYSAEMLKWHLWLAGKKLPDQHWHLALGCDPRAKRLQCVLCCLGELGLIC